MAIDEKSKDAQKIQESLINTFKKFAEKSIHDANYDKTILATIQYCTDATIGQYKIKYQNGYFTAYSKDLNVKYSNQAAVYVLVPGNDMNNRMFITGLATNNSADRTYITSMEGDQQYEVEGSNYIIGLNGDVSLDMSSYWGANKQYKKVLWSAADGSNNYLTVNEKVDSLLKEAKSIRIGAEFKTDLEESRKNGDYGLIFTFKYKNTETNEEYYKYFVIDTYHMIGSPFNFTDVYRPQYNIWDLESSHKTDFIGLDKIEAYVENFPSGIGNKIDIFIRNLSLHTAVKLYNTANDTNSVTLQCDQDFEFRPEDTKIKLKAILKVAGFEVNPDSNQNVEYYWGKEDLSVNSTNHAKYNSYLGKGWYCLNPSSKANNAEAQSIEALKQYTIAQDDLSVPNQDVVWDTSKQEIFLNKTLCKGRKTRVKCVCYYNNQVISSPIKDIINGEGLYLLLTSADSKVESYNGLGDFTLTAGVFGDTDGGTAPVSHTLDTNISYVWEETDSTGLTKTIPPSIEEFLFSNEEWSKNSDNETKTDEEVEEYLDNRNDLRLCKERYDYYLQKSNYYNDLENRTTEQETYLENCNSRLVDIISTENELIDSYYTENYNNTMYYIFGPSETEAIYDSNGDPQISNTVPYYYIENPPEEYPTQTNTLYKLPATKIGQRSTYKVTALLTDGETGITQSIGTESIVLVNSSGAALNYTLEITNGIQTFVYDEGGVRPSVTIQPLFFKLYNLSGDLLYDSEYPESSDVYNITNLRPRWFFYDSKYSLLLNNYKDSDNCTLHLKSEGVYKLSHEGQFYYQLRDQYDVTRKEKSNISLHVTVDGATIIGSTQFTFMKEGELGTNGTNTALDIDDNTYNGYRNNVLAGYNFATFYDTEGQKHYYQPPQRYVNNTYLYATMSYNGNGVAQQSVKDSNYVNLQFAQGGDDTVAENFERGIALVGSPTATLYGYWYGDGGRQLIDENTSKWSTMLEKGTYKNKDYYLYPSFSIKSQGDHALLTIKTKGTTDIESYSWKPSMIKNVTIGDTHYDYKIANNTVKAEAKQLFGDVQRSNYGFYTIPYYYFNYTGTTQMPKGVDPARHIIVVGGFDQVVYDSAGANPTYDKQNPFSFYMINENGRNITGEVIEGLATNKTTIEWTCSDAFISVTGDLPSTDISKIPTYNSYGDDVSLFNKYCKHGMDGNKPRIWKCIVNHTKGQKVKINGKTIDPKETFIKSYWEEVDFYAEAYQKFNIRPKGMYESIAQSDLFNSWVHLYVRYAKTNTRVYEAEVLIPINVICNKYGSEEINDWDGKSTKVDDSYIISSKVAAGVKNDNNTFTGITLGTNFYTDNKNRKAEVGLFGYGQTDANNPESWARTLFLDANTGRMILGPTGSSQIVIDPTIPTGTNQVWSRLAGWYISPDYFYKPIGEETIDKNEYKNDFTNLAQGKKLQPKDGAGSVGMYCPWNKTVTSDQVWLWADNDKATWQNHRNAKFKVTYGGHLYCTDADISGTITAISGSFGTTTNKLLINHTLEEEDEENHEKVTQHFLLYNKNFWVRDEGGTTNKETAIYIKGKIMAKSGQFGRVSDTADGDNSGIVFINYKWYPWHLPSDSEPWNNDTVYLDKSQGMIEQYILYHKNLYLAHDGSAFFNGKIYAEKGRIASWVIRNNQLASYDGTVYLSPSAGLRLGTFYAEPSGAIGNRGHWWITADGNASFDNDNNTFRGKSFVTNNGTGMSDANGLRLGPTDKFYIGQGDATYIEAGNAGFKFNGTAEFTADIEIKDSLTFSQGTGGAMYLNNSGIHMSGSGGSFTISPSGNVELNVIDSKEINTEGNLNVDGAAYITSAAHLNSDLEVGGATYLTNDTFINGTRLVDYIRQIIVGRLTGTTEVITQLGKSYGVNIHSTE